MDHTRDDATANVIGALAHALLRVFEVSARAAATAPSLVLRERQAEFAVEEHKRYQVLRRRLDALTVDPEEAMARFRGAVDAFYDAAPAGSWLDAQAFHFVGDAITTDFAELLAVHLDERTAGAVREALTGRSAQEGFALQQIREAINADGDAARERVRAVVGRVVGDALNRLREALLESNALAVVLGGEAAVKDMVLELLGRHRERLERLGLDRVDD